MDDSRIPCSMCSKSFKSMFTLRRHCRKIHSVSVPSRTYGRDSSQEFYCRAAGVEIETLLTTSSDDDDDGSKPSQANERGLDVTPYDPEVAGLSSTDQQARRTELHCIRQQTRNDVTSHYAPSASRSEQHHARGDPSQYLHGDLPLEQYVSIIAAVRDLLEQHDTYNLPALCNFIHLKYPTIPANVVPYVVHAACEGAKYASQMYLVQRSYAGSERASHLESANNAVISLTAWSVGSRPYGHSLSTNRSTGAAPVPTYKPTPKTQLIDAKKADGQLLSFSQSDSGSSSTRDVSPHRLPVSEVEKLLAQPRVVIPEAEKTRANESLNVNNSAENIDRSKEGVSQRTITPIYNWSVDTSLIPSIQPPADSTQPIPTDETARDYLQELEGDIVARALTMNDIDSLLDTDDGTLEDLIGQQSATFGDDHVLNVEVMTQDALDRSENPELEPTLINGKTQPPAPDFTKIHDKKRARHESQEASQPADQEARDAGSRLEVNSRASETKKPRKERDDNDTGIQPERNNEKREDSNDGKARFTWPCESGRETRPCHTAECSGCHTGDWWTPALPGRLPGRKTRACEQGPESTEKCPEKALHCNAFLITRLVPTAM